MSTDWTNRGGFWSGSFLPSIPHCVIRKFGYLQKLGYFPLALVPDSCTLIALSAKLVVIISGLVSWRHLYDSPLAVFYKSFNCHPLTQLRMCCKYNLFLQLTRFWFLTDVLRHTGLSTVAELLVACLKLLCGDKQAVTQNDCPASYRVGILA